MAKDQNSSEKAKGKSRKMRKQRRLRIGEVIVQRLRDYVEWLKKGENLAKEIKCYVVTAAGTRKHLRKFP